MRKGLVVCAVCNGYREYLVIQKQVNQYLFRANVCSGFYKDTRNVDIHIMTACSPFIRDTTAECEGNYLDTRN